MNKELSIEILTPSGRYLKTVADFLSVKGGKGMIGILPNHAPLITTIEVSKLTIRKNGKESIYAVSEGLMHIKEGSNITISVNSIEASDEIDIDRALKAKQRAEENMLDPEKDILRAKAALARALNRINIYNTKN